MRRVTAASWMLESIGEIGANFSLQLSSRTEFAKIKNKKVIAENQCENIQKIEFMIVHTWADQLLPQLLMEQFNTLPSQCRHIEHMFEGVWLKIFF